VKLKYSLITVLLSLAVTLIAAACFAGWTDAVNDTGSQFADEGAKAAGLPYTPSEAVAGVREVLSLGTDSAVSTLGQPGGFSSNPAMAIPLPDMLKGLGGDSSGLVSSMNMAAESAVPSTGNIFLDAIQNLAVGDASTLLGGGEDAITRFFEKSSRATLKTLVKPIVTTSVDQTGAGTYLNAMFATQQATGIDGPTFDVYDYVTDRTLDGMFLVMGMQEKSIRADGGLQTSDLLQKIF